VLTESAERPDETNERVVALVALLVAAGALAIDHLLGTSGGDEDDFPVDPAMFAIGVVLSAVAAFGWLVPRERKRGPERAARSGLACSILSVVRGIAVVWVGFPFLIAGAGLALGLEGRRGDRYREATAAVLIGALVLVPGAAA
jgi:4-amino-4-deoxy-L-arabinose transferase-like glycosyltransferase